MTGTRLRAFAACVALAIATMSGCGDDKCGGRQTDSKALAPGESATVQVERVGNVWKPVDANGRLWEYQALGPRDLANGTYEVTVTENADRLIVKMPGHDPVTLTTGPCA